MLTTRLLQKPNTGEISKTSNMGKLHKTLVSFFICILLLGCSNDNLDELEATSIETYKISDQGSSRATAYKDSNKIIETDDWIFFSWLDNIEGNLTVTVAQLDKKTNEVTSTINVDNEVFDNHGGPALVIDNQGFLHIFYGPHNGPMIYRKSISPYDISKWTDKSYIGEELTYPSVCIDINNTIYLVARHRESYGPWSLQFFKKEEMGAWSKPTDLLISNFKKWQEDNVELSRDGGYVRWGKVLQLDPDGVTLHLAFKNDEALPNDLDANYKRSNGLGSYFVGYMSSKTGGDTWSAYNRILDLPATPQTVEIISGASYPPNSGPHYEISNISFDSSGDPHALLIEQFENFTKLSMAKRANDHWHLEPINIESSNRIISPTVLFIDNSDNFYTFLSTIDPQEYCTCGGYFAQSFNSLELHTSRDGHSFEHLDVFDQNLEALKPMWFPSVNYAQSSERLPSFLFTVGQKNLPSTETTPNEVYIMKIHH